MQKYTKNITNEKPQVDEGNVVRLSWSKVLKCNNILRLRK